MNFPWVQDGLSDSERNNIDNLLYIGVGHISNLEQTLDLRWMQDDITETEHDAIYQLRRLNYDNKMETAVILTMPFMASLEPDDVLAIRGMYSLANDGLLSPLMDHPTFTSGITDAQTTLVIAIGTLGDLEEINRMLSPGYAVTENVLMGTDLTPHLEISIVRTGTQSQPGTIESVFDAVEFAEGMMQFAFPTSHVIVVLNEKAVSPGSAGTNHGFAMGYSPKYEQRQDSWEWRQLQAGFVHEIAHYYWRGFIGWIDEGMADTFEYIYGSNHGLSYGQMKPKRKTCEAHDLQMLSAWDPNPGDASYGCSYYLGNQLFIELLTNMQSGEFNERVSELYQLLTKDSNPIEVVRMVFAGQLDIVNKHWDGALNAPENRPFDEGKDHTNHHLIQWETVSNLR